MAQHFLLSAKARTLSLKAIFRMSDEEAHAAFTAIRFADNGGCRAGVAGQSDVERILATGGTIASASKMPSGKKRRTATS